jgi:glycosyltransferase involved in cell wall biosynthesis
MNQFPVTTIVITCYNLGEFVHEALESALAQTYPNVEVLLIDDGSTDQATITVLDTLRPHPRLRVLRTANQGVARARNTAIEQATGEYILPLDADDRILPAYVERAVAVLEQDPQVGFVGCHYRVFGERTAEYRPSEYKLPDMLVENIVPIASVYRKRCWEEVGGYCSELNSIEDWDLWISVLGKDYLGVVLPEIHFEYRVRPHSNLSHIRDPDIYQQRMQLLYQRHSKMYVQYAAQVLMLKDRQFAEMHSYAMWQEQQAKNWEEATMQQKQEIQRMEAQLGSLAKLQQWYVTQNRQIKVLWNRIQSVMQQSATPIEKVKIILHGMLRVIKRRMQS